MAKKITELTNWAELQKMLDEDEKKNSLVILDPEKFETALLARVRGQDEIVKSVAKLIRLQLAKTNSGRPIANLLFLGPTGTGKTELAKAIAEALFGDEKAMIRFDCSEFTGDHSKDRLIGMPLGYHGAEMGGQLTRPMQGDGRRLILFDEIEKAHPSIFDLFLQLMGEGRLTEQGSGKTVDFSKCIIVLTSNAQSEQIVSISNTYSDSIEKLNAVKSHLADTHTFRTEIMARIDKVFVFNSLNNKMIAEIALMKISKLVTEYGMEVEFIDPDLLMQILSKNQKISRFGVRELERIIFDLFADQLAHYRGKGIAKITLRATADKAGVEVKTVKPGKSPDKSEK